MVMMKMKVPAWETQVNLPFTILTYLIYITGGPLMTTGLTGKGQTYELIGAVSWGNGPCTSKTFPGVYARISTMQDWIVKTTEKEWSSCECVKGVYN